MMKQVDNPYRRALLGALVVGAAGFPLLSMAGQGYPSGPIKIVVPFPPGGIADVMARGYAVMLAKRLGQSVIVENKPGASGAIGVGEVKRAAPDGLTLLLTGSSSFTVTPAVNDKLQYDGLKDLLHLSGLANAPMLVVVKADSPFLSLADIVKAAKANPGTVTFGTFGEGSAPHLIGEMLGTAGGVKMIAVPYRGSAPMVTALLSGETGFAIDTVPSSIAQVRAGKLRALAVSSNARLEVLPGVPTFKEQGYAAAGYEGWVDLSVPKGTPADIVARLRTETQGVLASPEFKDLLRSTSSGPAPIAADQIPEQIRVDLKRFSDVARAAGIHIQ